MSRRFHSPDKRAAAIADYYDSGDTAVAVATRHGIPRATFSAWVTRANEERAIAYTGGWYVRGGVRYPLLPEQRSA